MRGEKSLFQRAGMLLSRYGVLGSIPRLARKLLAFTGIAASHVGHGLEAGSRSEFESLLSPQNICAGGSAPDRTINWLIPQLDHGSGGAGTITKLMAGLGDLGFRQRAGILRPGGFSERESAEAVARVRNVAGQSLEAVTTTLADLSPAEYTIATVWYTAYSAALTKKTKRAYLVQDFEPYFYPVGSTYHFAENTYRLGLRGITIGSWLCDKLRADYGMVTSAFPFFYDPVTYVRTDSRRLGTRVIFYGRPSTPRRGFELGMLALKKLKLKIPLLEVVLVGGGAEAEILPDWVSDAGSLAPKDLAALYNGCQAGLVLSLTNLSLVPLEMMACGCPVVSNHGSNDDFLLRDRENSLLAAPSPDSLADSLYLALTDHGLREKIVDGGFRTCRAATLQTAVEAFVRGLSEVDFG